ncbi:hypothetical protein ACFWPU_15270 [Streptomyces sp. NPDC058471]|uniref:hypothetical protein n=1 Tax=Streptomyces sp. NPDC058471 TaxID=3346516 RepID=UPI003663337F
MSTDEYPTAWNHPATRRIWALHMVMNVLGFLGWVALWCGSLAVLVGFLSPGFSFLFVPLVVYSAYRVVLQVSYFPLAFRMRRIMRTYPWQEMQGVPCGLTKHPDVLGRQYGWFELPNPARPEQRLPLVFGQHMRTEWWSRRMAPRAKPERKAQIEVVWFAGDPRFIGLIAAPTSNGRALRRMHVLQQQMGGAGDRHCFTDWGVTPEDIERGRRVGIRPAHP